MLPNLFLAGAMRAGTTALWRVLSASPDVFSPQEKEPQHVAFRDTSFSGPGSARFHAESIKDRAEYERLYVDSDTCTSPRWRVDASATSYLAPDRLVHAADETVDSRVILLLRHPVDRALSAFDYCRRRGEEPESDFLRALRLEEQRRRSGWMPMFWYKAASDYRNCVMALRPLHAQGRVLYLAYEQLENDAQSVINAVESFLDTPLASEALSRVNSGGRPRVRVLDRALTSPLVRARIREMRLPDPVLRFARTLREHNVHDRVVKREKTHLAEFEAELAGMEQLGFLTQLPLTELWA